MRETTPKAIYPVGAVQRSEDRSAVASETSARQRRELDGQPQRGRMEDTRRCFRCQEIGHIARNCVNRQSDDSLERNGPRNGIKVNALCRASGKGLTVYLKLCYGNTSWLCLLDTGCEKSIVPLRMVEELELNRSTEELFAANGTPIATVGSTEIPLHVAGMILPAEVVVTEHVREPMLGGDWIRKHGCVIDLQRGIATIQGKELKLEAREGVQMCRRVVVVRREEIPAWSERVIEGRIELGRITGDVGEVWCTEAREVAPGVCVARALLPDRLDEVPVVVMNVSDASVTLEAGSELSELESATTRREAASRPTLPCPTCTDESSTPHDFPTPHAFYTEDFSTPHAFLHRMPFDTADLSTPYHSHTKDATVEGSQVRSVEERSEGKEAAEEEKQGGNRGAAGSLKDRDALADEGFKMEPLLDHLSARATAEGKEEIISLLGEFQDIFSRNEYDLGETNLGVHRIDTGNAAPIRQPLRRHPHHLLEQIDGQVDKLIEARVVQKSTSPWASNIVMVKKHDGSYRMCVDLRGLNSVTKKDAFPLPRIDACLDALAGSQFYSTFDLTSGYFQVKMEPSDAEKTSFITRRGSYEFVKMSMGLCNAGSTFSRIMQLAMQGLNLQVCLCYLDDIIVFSRDVEDHIQRLRSVFQRLREANLKVKPSKCHLVQEEVAFLGHRVSAAGIATDPDKVRAVREWPVPQSIHDVRAFIGITSYYRRFIGRYGEICAPLHALTGKNARFAWTDECDAAFNQLKEALTTAPILAMPTDEDMFIIDTDASDRCLGAVLSQRQHGEEKVIAYASKVLSRAERNYCCTRRELLAVVYFVKYFKAYLLGRKFLLRTDHAALTWLRKTPEPIGQQARWCEILEEFDFEIQHRPGRAHGNADGLSRRPCRQCNWDEETAEYLVRGISFALPSEVQGSQWNPSTLAEASREDPDIGEIIRMKMTLEEPPPWEEVSGADPRLKNYVSEWERLIVKNGILYRIWWKTDGQPDYLQLVPPMSYRKEIMELAHSGYGGGHMGVRKTKEKVRRQAWWVDWAKDVDRSVVHVWSVPDTFGGLRSIKVSCSTHL